ncbi:meiosis inhibitor protein 1 [Antennarius striatus]|uniref:meiosis inhibitor protein 1 n=1 Tax=Antennarius striatus TaxID=241820 RepID=UPI0035B268F9
MASRDIVYDKNHFRHDPKWSGRLGPAEGGGLLLCVACVVEMIDSESIAVGNKTSFSVRKSFALSGLSGVLKCSPGTLRELLRQDHRVSLHFISSLLGMLHSTKDPDTLEKADQVLIQLLLELQTELSFSFILDLIHKQLSDQASVKDLWPIFSFLGNLVEAVPDVAHTLVTQYAPLLEHLCSALLHPDDTLKASVLYVWLKLFGVAGGSAVQFLPTTMRDRVCVLLLETLSKAGNPQLINNCIGLLWLLVQQGEAVSVLMSHQIPCRESQSSHINSSQILCQDQEQQSPDRCPLPLILKKLLLSGDEMLQTTSAKCIAAILVHSPSQSSLPFIKADLPEFLFDRLASSRSEVLLWSVYSCLLLLTEDPLFFSQCHSVYGIESLVRSLKEALRLTNLEVPKQGLLLLTEILERQPASVRLFPTGPGFTAVSEAVAAGVSCSCLLVATQAANAAAALFKLNHQSRPVHYGEIEGLIEAITNRFSELSIPSHAHRRNSVSSFLLRGGMKRSDPHSHASRSEGFLFQALVCFHAACRLAEECASDPCVKENTFTAPSKHSQRQDSLDSLCRCLLRCCDSTWIPTVTRISEHVSNAQILQYFYSILSSQFTLLPSLMPVFANKLASSGFYRMVLEHKGLLCAGNRNPNLNASGCGFLLRLSMCLITHSDPVFGASQHDVEEVENLLLHNLPSVCFRLSNWPSWLCEVPGFQLCEYKGQRATQYCLLIILHLAMEQGDRLLPDHVVFSSVVRLLHSVQEQGNCFLPRSVLRSALYLLAMTQDKSPDLEGGPFNCVSKVLSSCQSFSSLYIHHPAILHFIFRYPALAEKYGSLVLELWLTKPAQYTDTGQIKERGERRETGTDKLDRETKELLTLIEKHPSVTMTLLDIVCTREAPLASQALHVLEVLLRGKRNFDVDLCTNLQPALLQALQRLSMEDMDNGFGPGHAAQEVDSLPLVLKLLCVTQANEPPSASSYIKMDGVHFKLFYHVSNIAGRLKPTSTESLLSALSYLYCCLTLSPVHCTDRAVSMLLSNSRLMDQLQRVLSSSTAPSFSSSTCPPSSLLCCGHLLLSSLITLQRFHSAQVFKSISWSLDSAVQRLLVQKRNTDSLLLASYLRLLQAVLNGDLVSPVVCISTSPGLIGHRPLGIEDGALYPLGSRGAQCLSVALSGLLLQKHELLLRASVNCLSSLLGFLQRRSPSTAKYVVCQPWTGFLLRCLLSSEESCLVHPAVLRVITLLLLHGRPAVQREVDLMRIMEAAQKKGLKELREEASQALRQLLTQIQSNVLEPPVGEEQRQRARSMMEALSSQTSEAESCSPCRRSGILLVGDVSICLSDFTVKTD